MRCCCSETRAAAVSSCRVCLKQTHIASPLFAVRYIYYYLMNAGGAHTTPEMDVRVGSSEFAIDLRGDEPEIPERLWVVCGSATATLLNLRDVVLHQKTASVYVTSPPEYAGKTVSGPEFEKYGGRARCKKHKSSISTYAVVDASGKVTSLTLQKLVETLGRYESKRPRSRVLQPSAELQSAASFVITHSHIQMKKKDLLDRLVLQGFSEDDVFVYVNAMTMIPEAIHLRTMLPIHNKKLHGAAAAASSRVASGEERTAPTKRALDDMARSLREKVTDFVELYTKQDVLMARDRVVTDVIPHVDGSVSNLIYVHADFEQPLTCMGGNDAIESFCHAWREHHLRKTEAHSLSDVVVEARPVKAPRIEGTGRPGPSSVTREVVDDIDFRNALDAAFDDIEDIFSFDGNNLDVLPCDLLAEPGDPCAADLARQMIC